MSKNYPKHIAIIMDGNRRWAKKKSVPAFLGHKQGVENVRKIVKTCGELGVKYLTLYTFSTENWKRDKKEIQYLMELFDWAIEQYIDELDEQKVQLNIFGDLQDFSKAKQDLISKAIERLSGNQNLILNLALNYGSREEIIKAMQDMQNNQNITEKEFAKHLYSGKLNIPDPDLIIRTGGELRLSNFLLWQAAYSELYFTPTFWPDFSASHLKKAIQDYQARKRRFGK